MRKSFYDFIAPMKRMLSLEDDLTGKVQIEAEKSWYGQLSDIAQLSKADRSSDQEQWSIKIDNTRKNDDGMKAPGKGSIRVRKTTVSGSSESELSLTIKVKLDDGSSLETSSSCTADVFNMVKALAASGMIKTRFEFDIEGTDKKWEVDVFKTEDGSYYDWCKIDLELDHMSDTHGPFPVDLRRVISGDEKLQTDDEKERLDVLFKTMFLTSSKKEEGL